MKQVMTDDIVNVLLCKFVGDHNCQHDFHKILGKINYRLLVIKLHKWMRIRNFVNPNKEKFRLDDREIRTFELLIENYTHVSSVFVITNKFLHFNERLTHDQVSLVQKIILERVEVKLYD